MAHRNRRVLENDIEKVLLEELDNSDTDSTDSEIRELEDSDDDGVVSDQREDDEFDGNSASEDEEMTGRKVIYGKNGHKWYTNPFHSKTTRTASKNIVLHLPGTKGQAKGVTEVKDIWSLLISDEVIGKIVMHTNEEIEKQKSRYNSNQSYLSSTNQTEIHALIGLLYVSGVLKKAHLSLNDLWSKAFGPSCFRATMSKNRFEFLINCLRFDDKSTRAERREVDKFAPIREIWSTFITNCSSNYIPSEYVTVDEQLLGFRGRCPFKVYIPNKPDKYGLKIVTMCDSKTYYMCSAIPYIGKERRESNLSLPTQYVVQLTENIHGTNRNVTVDNWFCSCELADELTKRKLTVVGTMRKNKRDIPPQLLEVKRRPVASSEFAFDETTTIVSHVARKNKGVILISTMHQQGDVNEESKKPEIILFYNETKGGVDTFDQLSHNATVGRKTRRWPLRVFFGMLDTAGINSFIISKCNSAGNFKKRSDFLKALGFSLLEAHLTERVTCTRIPRELRVSIRDILGIEEGSKLPKLESRPGRCDFCPRKKDRKGQTRCVICCRSICAEHRMGMCPDCKENCV